MNAKQRLAEMINIKISMIYHLLNGVRNASGRTAVDISKATSSSVEIWWRPRTPEEKIQMIAARQAAFQTWAERNP